MKLSAEELLFHIKQDGITKTLERIEVETIEDHTIKVICRTIKYSHDELVKVLIDRVFDRANKGSK